MVILSMSNFVENCPSTSIFSILEPNVEGRERLKIGLKAVPPPLFGYPTSRRIVKLNLTKPAATKNKLASVVQEHVQEFYKYAGRVGDAKVDRAGDSGDTTFDDVNALVSPNAPPSAGVLASEGGDNERVHLGNNTNDEMMGGMIGGEDGQQQQDRTKFWMSQSPKGLYDYGAFTKTP